MILKMNQIKVRKNKKRKETREGSLLILKKLQKPINKLMINLQLLHRRNKQLHMKIILNLNNSLKSSKMIKSLKTEINSMTKIRGTKIKKNNHLHMTMNMIKGEMMEIQHN